jgi:hypothetical protein
MLFVFLDCVYIILLPDCPLVIDTIFSYTCTFLSVYYSRVDNLRYSISQRLGSHPVFGGVRVTHLFSFLCCMFCFVCLCPMSCVPNDASFSILFILVLVVECEGYLYQQMFHLSDKPCHMIVCQSIRSTIYIILE